MDSVVQVGPVKIIFARPKTREPNTLHICTQERVEGATAVTAHTLRSSNVNRLVFGRVTFCTSSIWPSNRTGHEVRERAPWKSTTGTTFPPKAHDGGKRLSAMPMVVLPCESYSHGPR